VKLATLIRDHRDVMQGMADDIHGIPAKRDSHQLLTRILNLAADVSHAEAIAYLASEPKKLVPEDPRRRRSAKSGETQKKPHKKTANKHGNDHPKRGRTGHRLGGEP
jgi:hypothetical protein